jgi:hypothetical protein
MVILDSGEPAADIARPRKAQQTPWGDGVSQVERRSRAGVTDGTKVESSTKETDTHIALGLDMTEYEVPIEHLLGGRASKIRKLLREIERVLFLAVAQYRSIVDAGEDGALFEEPHVRLADPRRQTGNRKQTARANSFFRIKRLPHLRGVTIMTDSHARQLVASDRDDGARRKLVEVRPFYRMQPCHPVWKRPSDARTTSSNRTIQRVIGSRTVLSDCDGGGVRC